MIAHDGMTTVDRVLHRIAQGNFPSGKPSLRNHLETEQQIKAARDLARSVGVPRIRRYTSKTALKCQWNGTTLFYDTAYNLYHEIAHFQVAAPDRRYQPNFGLGTGPDDRCAIPALIDNGDDEEVNASLLGIIWEAKHGQPFDMTLEWHQWETSNHDMDEIKSRITSLTRWNLLVGGEPQLNLRP